MAFENSNSKVNLEPEFTGYLLNRSLSDTFKSKFTENDNRNVKDIVRSVCKGHCEIVM